MRRERSTWSIQEAKNQFSRVVRAAQRGPQVVTRHGKAMVVILSTDEYARLQMRERRAASRFVEHLLAVPADDGDFERLPGSLRKFTP
jgi:prevent-host-death family protein